MFSLITKPELHSVKNLQSLLIFFNLNCILGGSSNKTSPTGEEIMEKEIPTTEETNLEESGKIKG